MQGKDLRQILVIFLAKGIVDHMRGPGYRPAMGKETALRHLQFTLEQVTTLSGRRREQLLKLFPEIFEEAWLEYERQKHLAHQEFLKKQGAAQ